jgi:hypothetical protein
VRGILSKRAHYLFCLLIGSGIMQQSAADETLHLSFESGSYLDETRREVDVSKTGQTAFSNGKKGNALRIGGVYGELKIDTKGVISASQGSVEMWVSPVDWRASDESFHVFFDARAAGALYLYKYFENSKLLLLSTRDRVVNENFVVGKTIDWQPGRWNHVVGTWSPKGLMLFINGEPVTRIPVEAELPGRLGDQFTIGDGAWDRPRLSSSLIDEVRLYNTPLSAAQVRNAYEGRHSYSLFPTPSSETFELRATLDKIRRQVHVELLSSHDVSRLGGQCALEVYSSNNSSMGRASIELGSSTTESIYIGPSPSKELQLRIRAQCAVAGRVLTKDESVDESSVNIPSVEPHRALPVPLPWEPLKKIPANPISIGANRYSLPSNSVHGLSIKNRFNDPIVTKYRIGYFEKGNERLVESVLEQKAVNTERSNIVDTTLSDGRVEVNSRVALDYDGTLRLSVAPRFELGKKTEDIFLDFLLPIELIDRLYMPGLDQATATFDSIKPAIGSKSGKTSVSSAYRPMIWVGTKDRGLFISFDTAVNWPNRDEKDAITIFRQGDDYVFRIHVGAFSATLLSPPRFEFQAFATPTKMRNDAIGSRIRLAPLRKPNLEIVWPSKDLSSTKYFGYPEARSLPLMRATIQTKRAHGRVVAPYLLPTFLSMASPEWQINKARWWMRQYDSTSTDVNWSGAALGMLSPRGEGLSAFMSSAIPRFLSDIQANGVYFDNVQAYGGYAPQAKLGFKLNGKSFREFPTLAYRDLYQSVYESIKATNEETTIILHVSGQINPFLTQYGDLFVNGEQYRGKIKTSYFDAASFEEFQYQYSKTLWGARPILIPQIPQEESSKSSVTREIMGIALVLDVAVWPVWCDLREVERAYRAFDNAADGADGHMGEPFVQTQLRNASPHFKVAIYTKSSVPLSIVVMNTGGSRGGHVCFANERLKSLRDAETDALIVPTGTGCFELPIKSREYAIYKIH